MNATTAATSIPSSTIELKESKCKETVVLPTPGIENKEEVKAKSTADLNKRRIIRLGLVTAAVLQLMKVGGFLFEHSVAFYAYVQYAPKTLWGQYFYANATHEAAKRILSTTVLGCSISAVMTSVLAVIAGVTISKIGAAIYNLCVERNKKISITLIDMISDIFSVVFRGTLV